MLSNSWSSVKPIRAVLTSNRGHLMNLLKYDEWIMFRLSRCSSQRSNNPQRKSDGNKWSSGRSSNNNHLIGIRQQLRISSILGAISSRPSQRKNKLLSSSSMWWILIFCLRWVVHPILSHKELNRRKFNHKSNNLCQFQEISLRNCNKVTKALSWAITLQHLRKNSRIKACRNLFLHSIRHNHHPRNNKYDRLLLAISIILPKLSIARKLWVNHGYKETKRSI